MYTAPTGNPWDTANPRSGTWLKSVLLLVSFVMVRSQKQRKTKRIKLIKTKGRIRDRVGVEVVVETVPNEDKISEIKCERNPSRLLTRIIFDVVLGCEV